MMRAACLLAALGLTAAAPLLRAGPNNSTCGKDPTKVPDCDKHDMGAPRPFLRALRACAAPPSVPARARPRRRGGAASPDARPSSPPAPSWPARTLGPRAPAHAVRVCGRGVALAGSCGNACCLVEITVPYPTAESYKGLKEYLQAGGDDGSFGYSTGEPRGSPPLPLGRERSPRQLSSPRAAPSAPVEQLPRARARRLKRAAVPLVTRQARTPPGTTPAMT